MKAQLKRMAGTGCRRLGIDRLLRRMRPGHYAILMFHRVVDTATLRASANSPLMVEEGMFAAMAATLARHCRCLPLAEAVSRAGDRKTSPIPTVVLTFDDGYGDFHDTAFPILRRFGLPATMFLSTGFLDHPGRMLWWDAVEAFFARPQATGFEDPALPAAFVREVRETARGSSPQRVESFIRGPMYRLSPRDRDRFLVRLPRGQRPRPAMLDWDQVRSLAASGLVDFGAHCVTHPFLDEMAPQAALEEIAISKGRIEAETGRPVTSFAYPSGRVPAAFREILPRAGIALAPTTRFGGNDASSDPLLLRRMDARFCLIGETFDPSYFLAVCGGCLDWLHGTREG